MQRKLFVKRTHKVSTAWRVLRLRMEERPPIWRVAVNKLNKQPRTADKDGPPACGLDEVLTTPLRKKQKLRITSKVRCFLWRQNNPEVNYSPTRISGGECF